MSARTAVLVGLGLAAGFAGAARAQTASGPVDEAEFARFLGEWMEAEMSETGVPGAVFLMVKDGGVFHARGFGSADLEEGRPVDPDRTVFRVGSNSKSVTAAAVLTLLDRGLVNLDVDVNEYLVSLEVPRAFGEPVTLRHLLTHTAGFDERLFGQHAAEREDALPLAEYLAENLPPRTSPPGRVISYNDFGTSLAGLVVEDVSGRPFADYVAEEVFAPLGMTSSSFDIFDLPSHVRENLAFAYRRHDGGYSPYAYNYIQTPPAAGLVATARDMGRFLAALLAGGGRDGARILSDSMTATMLSRQFAHDPLLRGRAFGFVESDENGVPALSKDGQATGFLSRIFLIPDADLAFFSSINLSIFEPGPSFNRASGFHRRLTSAILDRYFPPDSAAIDGPAAPAPDPEFDASPYVGTYRSMEGSRHTIEKLVFLGNETRVSDGGDGTLVVGGSRWVELEPGRFQHAEGGPHYLAFGLDEDGRARHLFIGAGALERAPWHDTMATATRVVRATGVVFLSGLLVWPIVAIVGRRRRANPHPSPWVAAGVSLLGLAFMVGFGWAFSTADFQDFFKGVPGTIAALLALPVALVPLTAVAIVEAVRAWAGGRGSLPARLHYSLVVAASVAFLFLLENWYLLGWRY